VGLSIEDKRAIAMMEGLLKMVNGAVVPSSITAVTTPPPLCAKLKAMVIRRAPLLEKRLLREGDLFSKYNATISILKKAIQREYPPIS